MIYDLVDMTDWITKDKIIKKVKSTGLELSERNFRFMVENINDDYIEHRTNIFIAHGNKGYKIAQNDEEIRKSADDYKSRAIDQFTKYHKIKKALGENANINLQLIDGELIFLEKENEENE